MTFFGWWEFSLSSSPSQSQDRRWKKAREKSNALRGPRSWAKHKKRLKEKRVPFAHTWKRGHFRTSHGRMGCPRRQTSSHPPMRDDRPKKKRASWLGDWAYEEQSWSCSMPRIFWRWFSNSQQKRVSNVQIWHATVTCLLILSACFVLHYWMWPFFSRETSSKHGLASMCCALCFCATILLSPPICTFRFSQLIAFLRGCLLFWWCIVYRALCLPSVPMLACPHSNQAQDKITFFSFFSFFSHFSVWTNWRPSSVDCNPSVLTHRIRLFFFPFLFSVGLCV